MWWRLCDHMLVDDSCENPGCMYSERALFLHGDSTTHWPSSHATLTGRRALNPTHHQHPYLSSDLQLCDQTRWCSWDPTQQNSMIALCTHTLRTVAFIRMWLLDSLNAKYAPPSKNEQLRWDKLCLYWHTVTFQLSLMKQHGYKLYSHQGTRIFVHFALWFIVYSVLWM